MGARLGEMTTKGYTTISVKGKSKIIHVYPESKEIGKVYTPIIGIRSISSEFSKISSSVSRCSSGLGFSYYTSSC